MRINSQNLITSNITLSGNWNSSAVWIGHAVNLSLYFKFTGVPEGIFSLEYSNDGISESGPETPTNWARIEGSEQTVAEAGTHGYQIANAGFRWVRAAYSYTAGIGILTILKVNVKGV